MNYEIKLTGQFYKKVAPLLLESSESFLSKVEAEFLALEFSIILYEYLNTDLSYKDLVYNMPELDWEDRKQSKKNKT